MVSYLCCNCLLALAVLEVAAALTEVSRFLSFFEVVEYLIDPFSNNIGTSGVERLCTLIDFFDCAVVNTNTQCFILGIV